MSSKQSVTISRESANVILNYIADLQDHIAELEEAFAYEPEKGVDCVRDELKRNYTKFAKALDALRCS